MKTLRLGSAVSAIALASMIAGCASPMSRSASVSKGKAPAAYGLRAQMALGSGDYASAVTLAEQAAEATPQDANIRSLLGNSYFASGRFASAEAAFTDSLALAPAQPQIILKRALVQIAQGKNDAAISGLQAAQGLIDPADFGLALALAGRPGDAVQMLDVAARAQGADSRVRQNLALANALAGDWEAARVIASQDLTPDLVDARVQQWMTLAKPAHSYDQVAALVGVTPAAADPGQPVRLALVQTDTRVAQAAPQPEVAAVQQAAVQDAPAFAAPVAEPVAVVQASAPAPVAAPEAPAFDPLAAVAAVATHAKDAVVEFASNLTSKPEPKVKRASAKVRAKGAPALGSAKALVQLGAYSSEERVSAAWATLSKKHPNLRKYSPMVARFDSPRGTVWRLSIRGFDNQQEAIARCQTLRSKGGSCFVRSTAGDSPVQFASR
jgi:D-alanyl-D-alanine carboxypeptidase